MATGKASKDEWRQCAEWLVRCRILAADHKVTTPGAEVFDLAQTLRDGVLICHLLNSLAPGSIDLREFSQRPQMSQFLCLKNIRTFLATCRTKFQMREVDLFDTLDLFDMKDFGKVLRTLSKLSKTPLATKSGIRGFPEGSVSVSKKDDYYNLLEMATTMDLEDPDELYDTVTTDDHDDIYDDLCSMKNKRKSIVSIPETPTKRDYCLRELVETEKNYIEVLQMIITHFARPLKSIVDDQDYLVIFKDVEELSKIHTGFHSELVKAMKGNGSPTVSDCFIKWKRQFLVYGEYCSNLPMMLERIEKVLKQSTLIAEAIKDCQMKANQGKFKLADLVAVPMQRVLKYHLLLKELLKQTDRGHAERDGLENALEAMQDLSLYVNEVKRDNETLQVMSDIHKSITDLQMPIGTSLRDYGRLLKDGELKVKSHEDNKLKPRHIFLFDKVMLMCKPRVVDKFLWGESYSYKNALILSQYKVDEGPGAPRPRAREFEFVLAEKNNRTCYNFAAKTEDTKLKWIEAIRMALDNTTPAGCKSNNHDFVMHTFEEPTECSVCGKLLRGVFYQGYKCQVSNMSVHKECIAKARPISTDGKPTVPPRPPAKQASSKNKSVIGKCKALYPYYGSPPPQDGRPVLTFEQGDVIDLTNQDDDNWLEGRFKGQEGFFPRTYVSIRLQRRTSYIQPPVEAAASSSPKRSTPLRDPHPAQASSPHWKNEYTGTPKRFSEQEDNLDAFNWFVGEMSRDIAVQRLERHPSGTYLIRESNNPQRKGEYSLSIKFGTSVKHIRVQRTPGAPAEQNFYLADCRLFRSIPELVEYYQQNTLQYSFPELETTLLIPYRDSSQNHNGTANGPYVSVSTNVLGYAIASYDYAATAPNQLSLKRGDRVAIVSKAGSDRGWWKGELNKRIGYFPMNYVVEDGDVLNF